MNRRLTSPRALVAWMILLLWLGGLGFLVRREYFRPNTERFAEAALRVSPGAVYYAVMQGSRQIGFASSTIDTATTTISVDDYLVADLPVGGRVHRASAHTHVVLTRALHMKAFAVTFEGDGGLIQARRGSRDGSTNKGASCGRQSWGWICVGCPTRLHSRTGASPAPETPILRAFRRTATSSRRRR